MSSQHICGICKHTFTTLSNLNLHLKTAKFCKNIREQSGIDSNTDCILHICTGCNKQFELKQSYDKHISTCKEKALKDLEDIHKLKLKEMEEKYELRIKELENKYNECNKERIRLQDSLLNDRRYTTNFIELFTSLVPFTEENLKNRVHQIRHTSLVYFNEPEVDKYFITNFVNVIKDMVFCTDISRNKLVVKREDNKCEKITSPIFVRECFDKSRSELLHILQNANKYCDTYKNSSSVIHEDYTKCKERIYMVSEYIKLKASNTDQFIKTISHNLSVNCKQLSKQ